MKSEADNRQRVIIVTGACRGIGKAITETFVDNGDLVAMVSENKNELLKTAASLSNPNNVLVLDTSSILSFNILTDIVITILFINKIKYVVIGWAHTIKYFM